MRHKGGAHGGAWKVAYADFVTAMMALFLVLWITASSVEVRKTIAGYFRSTALLTKDSRGVGILVPITQISKTRPRLTPPDPSSSGDLGGQMWAARVLSKEVTLQETASTIQRLLRRNNDEITYTDEFRFEFTNDGFRIEIMDLKRVPFFEPDTDRMTDYALEVLQIMAWELERYPFQVEVEGHIEGGSPPEQFGGWDLSTRRAIAAQQFLEKRGVRPTQFFRVAGYGDRKPLDKDKPNDPANRRISVVVRLDPNSDIGTIRRAFEDH
jgi:chemotaxis protein MotB